MGRTPCCDKNGVKKGPWTTEEDQKLTDYIQKYGPANWRTLPKNAGLQRCGKSCRLRWTNYLRPDIKRGKLSFEEEETIIHLHSILGNKWSAIAGRLPGRTDNEIKNYWNTHVRRKLLRMGIDPSRLDLLDLTSIFNPSLYNSSQVNLSRLLGVQSLVNPEILRLANSPFSLPSNFQENQLCNSHVQNQLTPFGQINQIQNPIQNIPTCTDLSTLFVPIYSDIQVMQQHNMEQLSSNISNFSSQNCQQNEWKNFNFRSVLPTLSTPSSSPTSLNSNSNTTSEEERESYCSMLNFDIPNILDVNELL
ncbi:hypothetical protein RND71_035275 [Anisodus tanguticus]|uniref:Uncharacterized protein n=1 Tax=Anisodus tanguticus TaxID=243964 RepID=A0AAE1V1F9_9SOLA|nr:hypothetical protein RND71_035275 [Anisodus tanguticus]